MDDWIIDFSYAIMPFFLGLILSFNLAHWVISIHTVSKLMTYQLNAKSWPYNLKRQSSNFFQDNCKMTISATYGAPNVISNESLRILSLVYLNPTKPTYKMRIAPLINICSGRLSSDMRLLTQTNSLSKNFKNYKFYLRNTDTSD
jgi:hypothetical protein